MGGQPVVMGWPSAAFPILLGRSFAEFATINPKIRCGDIPCGPSAQFVACRDVSPIWDQMEFCDCRPPAADPWTAPAYFDRL